jgi:hypothetical protein
MKISEIPLQPKKVPERADLINNKANISQTNPYSEIMQKNQKNQEISQEYINKKEEEDEAKIKEITQKLLGDSMGEISTQNQSEPEYSPRIKKFLDSSPEDIKEIIEKLSYFHVTHKNFGENILREGIKKNSEIIANADIDFLKELFDKYGDKTPISENFFKYHILGQEQDKGRSIWVSSSAMAKNYQMPEKLKFLLQNLNFLKKSNRLTAEEKIACQNMFDRYLATFKDTKDGVYVLKIKASSPPLLNEILGKYELEKTSPNLIKKILGKYEPNLEIKQDIPTKYISIEEKKDFDYGAILNDLERTSFLVFKD